MPNEKPGEKSEKSDKKSIANMTAKEIMTAEAWAVTPDMTVQAIMQELINKKFSGAPVVDSMKKCISVVSEVDLMKFAAAGGIKKQLSDFMDKLVSADNVLKVEKNDPFKEIFKHFLLNPVRRVIVVDSSNKVQGIISRRDILKAFLAVEGQKEEQKPTT